MNDTELSMKREQDRTLQAYMHLMLEHLPVGVALFDVSDFRLLAANAQYHALQQPAWQHGHALGHTLAELFPEEECLAITALFQLVTRTGVACHIDKDVYTTLAQGGTFWHGALDPIFEHDQVCYVMLTLTEILPQSVAHTSTKQEPCVREETPHVVEMERQRLHTILDQLPEGVLLVEAVAGRVSYANAAASHLLGLALPQLLGGSLKQAMLRSPYQLSRQKQQSAVRWDFPLIHALWGKTITNQELFITRPDGSEIVVLSSAAPIHTTDGLISEAVMVFQDITALKQLEQQKNDFFAVANHELRTPLTIITGFTELLHQHAPETADTMYQYALSCILQESERLTQLVHEMLDFSRPQQAQLEIHRSYQDLLAPFKEMINKHIHTTKTHQVSFLLQDLASTQPLIGHFDLPRIEQIMRNLIGNAVKYSPTGSEIEVGMRPQRAAYGAIQEVLIWVKDQGMGIAADDLPHIFERFYRADKRYRSISGFGIGLYMTRALVQGHGGRIWVESWEGRGSTFFVVLPLQAPVQDAL